MAVLESGGAVVAQGMNDPTRPPSGFAVGDPEGAALAGGPLLQSVLISPSGSAAIINGETIKVGQKFGDAVLVKVAESEVVLRSGSGTQVLKLYPGVEKRASAPPAAGITPRRGTGATAPAGAARPRQGE